MLDTLRPGPTIWSPDYSETNPQRGFAAPLSTTPEDQPAIQPEPIPQSQEKTITLAELDIHALTEQVLALLSDPNREEFKYGSPESLLIRIQDDPFIIADLVIDPPGLKHSDVRLYLRIIPPILDVSDEPTKYMELVINRTRRDELRINDDQIEKFSKMQHYSSEFDRNTWLTHIQERAMNYVDRRSHTWLIMIDSNRMTPDSLQNEKEEFWNAVFNINGSTIIEGKLGQDIRLKGFISKSDFNSIKFEVYNFWNAFLKKQGRITTGKLTMDQIKLTRFTDELLLTADLMKSDRSKADFPDEAQLQVYLKENDSTGNKTLITYLLAELKAAVGLWHAHPGLRDDPLTAGGMLFPKEQDSAPLPSKSSSGTPQIDEEITRPIWRGFLGYSGIVQPATRPSHTPQNSRPLGFSTPRR